MSKKAVRSFALWFLFVLCFVPAVFLFWHIESTPVPYEAVWAQVTGVKDGAVSGRPRVTVSYDGSTLKLQKPDEDYDYRPGKVMNVYLAGGRLYASAEDIHGFRLTPLNAVRVLWLIFAFGSFVLLIAAVLSTEGGLRLKKPQKALPATARPGFDPELKR